MEFAAFRSRPTAAAAPADDEEIGRLRRFPEPPPPSQPHGHDAALLTRRQELLLELYKGFMHQDMIWRELMETERAMGLTAGGYNCNPVSALPWSQDYSRRWTSSVPSWETPLRQPCPCGHESSKAVKAPPLYPHVERSPEQTRPGNDAEQHQDGRSSGVRIKQFDGYFELCYSPSKQTPVAAEAGINQMRPSSGHQQAIVGEKIGVEYVQNMQPSHEIKNQSSEGRKADSAIDDSIKKPMQLRLQYKPADQENAANNDQKSTEFNKQTLEGTCAGLKRKLTAPSSPVKKQQTYGRQDVKEEVPENRWTCRLCQAKCTRESDYHSHLGGRRHRENEEASRARFYCWVCDVQCNSEKNLDSHLGGRRHRETVEGSDSD